MKRDSSIVKWRGLTTEVGEHGGESDGQEDECYAAALPGAPVLAALVDVKS